MDVLTEQSTIDRRSTRGSHWIVAGGTKVAFWWRDNPKIQSVGRTGDEVINMAYTYKICLAGITLSGLLAAGCGDNTAAPGLDTGPKLDQVSTDAYQDQGQVDGQVDDSGSDASGGGVIQIFVKGDHTKTTYNDGLAGQTPKDYKIAISRYHIMTSATAKPVLCFDHGTNPKITDMSKDTLVGSCDTKSVPDGNYTHGRTKVDWAKFTVDGVYHYLGIKYPGKFTFFRAYSDTVYNKVPYKANTGSVTFSGLTTVSLPIIYGPLPSVPGVSFETKSGEFFMTFRYKKVLPIVQTNTKTHWARFHWKVLESFRWKELSTLGFKSDVWDVTPIAVTSEEVKLHGVSGYHVTSSVD